ncbi:MAG: class I SAM-dependent methyltransferase [Candidatus Acidiferrales bacterium]
MSKIEDHRRDWEDLGELDPLWAVLSDPARKFGKWPLEEFFHTGEEEVRGILSLAAKLHCPYQRHRALDFGCGVGRITRALSPYFTHCYGVDVSEQMVNNAKELNSFATNCEFIVNKESNLERFPDGYFDFITSRLVLQHLPRRTLALSYIAEFVRTLVPGGLLVFQMPTHIPLRNRVQLRRRAYRVLKKLGLNSSFLYNFLGLHPVRMISLSRERVLSHICKEKGRVLLFTPDEFPSGVQLRSNTYFISK